MLPAFRAAIFLTALQGLVNLVVSQLDAQKAKEFIDDILDLAEDRFETNRTIINGINKLRQIVSIPDDIGGDEN